MLETRQHSSINGSDAMSFIERVFEYIGVFFVLQVLICSVVTLYYLDIIDADE
jgi:hypothetical protein